MIDAGAFLTKITSEDGEGNQMNVQDSTFFYDGIGIQNDLGDRVMIESISSKIIQSATVVKIDRNLNRLYLDKKISWQKGDRITLAYEGKQPDIGAFEFIN